MCRHMTVQIGALSFCTAHEMTTMTTTTTPKINSFYNLFKYSMHYFIRFVFPPPVEMRRFFFVRAKLSRLNGRQPFSIGVHRAVLRRCHSNSFEQYAHKCNHEPRQYLLHNISTEQTYPTKRKENRSAHKIHFGLW